MWEKIKKIFVKEKVQQSKIVDYVDQNTKQVTKSALEYNSHGKRLLRLQNTDCAFVLHDQGKVEVIFSKLYDPENQQITDSEQTLMALALFLKQPRFAQMLRYQFRRIAMKNIKDLTEEKKQEK